MTSRKFYYWLATREENGKPYLIFGGVGEEEARQKGLEMLSGLDFEIKRYPTRSLQQASAYLRGKRLEEGLGLRKSAQRQGHEKSILRRQHRLEKQSRW